MRVNLELDLSRNVETCWQGRELENRRLSLAVEVRQVVIGESELIDRYITLCLGWVRSVEVGGAANGHIKRRDRTIVSRRQKYQGINNGYVGLANLIVDIVNLRHLYIVYTFVVPTLVYFDNLAVLQLPH